MAVEEDGSCTEPCGPSANALVEPAIAPATVTAAAGSTPLTVEFSLPERLPRKSRYLVTLYAGKTKWDALAHSPERLELAGR